MEITIRAALPSDIPAIHAIARQHSEAVSWLPDAATRHYIGLGMSVIAEGPYGPIGFLLGTSSMMHAPALAKIYQIAVAKSIQGRGCGYRLFEAFQRECSRLHAKAIAAHVADNLPCLNWWMRQQFDCLGTAAGGTKRQRRLIIYYHELEANAQEDPWARPPAHRPGGKFQRQTILDHFTEGADID